jgi:hypothetical protein
MRRVRDYEEIIAAQRADLEAAARRARWVEGHHRLSIITAGAKRWTKTLKAVAGVVSAAVLVLSGVAGGSAKIYRGARKVYGALTLMRVRDEVPPAMPPVVPGLHTIATDRVPEPPKKGP